VSAFEEHIVASGHEPLRAVGIETLQVNLGKVCNQTCRHCHVAAGPGRTEVMTRGTVDQVVDVLRRFAIPKLDLTGGAPELNPHFEYLVREARALGLHVIDRCNLTVFFLEGKRHLPEFMRDQQVEVTASMPCYLQENVEAQRGKGVYEKSIEALQWLNRLGYGRLGTGLTLNLVYNPVSPSLPPVQKSLEEAYRQQLGERFGIVFSTLYTMINMPINRFSTSLIRDGGYEVYMDLLVQNFNPATLDGLMCRTTLSVGWDGTLYDCDFNQMLDMPLGRPLPGHIREFDAFVLSRRKIRTGPHCFGCAAGSGSSCTGALSEIPHGVPQTA
jgi:radical SAM/Cys-rich protein